MLPTKSRSVPTGRDYYWDERAAEIRDKIATLKQLRGKQRHTI